MKKKIIMAAVLCMTVASTMCFGGNVSASTGGGASAKAVKTEAVTAATSRSSVKSAAASAARPMASTNKFTLGKSAVIYLKSYVGGVSFSVRNSKGAETVITSYSASGKTYAKTLPAGSYTITTTASLNDYEYICVYNTNRTIKVNRAEMVGNVDTATRYLKFKATKTGYLDVEDYINMYSGTWLGGHLSGNVTLLNSKKKAISSAAYFSGGSSYDYQKYVVFGVTKGKTYYLKVKCYGLYNDGLYTLYAKNSAVKEKSGSKKSKAKSLASNKYKTGTITAGSSRSDWYKFRSSKKNVSVYFVGANSTNESLKVTVYKGRNKFYSTISRGGSDKQLKMTNWGSGTYYVKVARGTSKSSGYYKIKYK